MDRKREDRPFENPTAATRGRRSMWVFLGFLLVAATFLWAEHRAHLMGVLPYALILLCPLLHFFHHRGHGSHKHHVRSERSPAEATSVESKVQGGES